MGLIAPLRSTSYLTTALLLTTSVVSLQAQTVTNITQVIFSNNGGSGDNFTNASTTNTGQAVGSTGWHYNNVRNNGVVGINTNLARSGNGSAWMQTTQGPGGNSSKADIEFFNTSVTDSAGNYNPTSSLGKLSNLTNFSYEWFRNDDGGTAEAHLHPSLRLQLVSNDLSKSGYLVFEREVNRESFGFPPGPTNVPKNMWTLDDILNSNYRMWSTGNTLPNNLNGSNGTAQYYDARRLQDWISSYGDYNIIGISAGVGSGWGTFTGAVDNITVGFKDASNNVLNTTYNFEVVPEPAFYQSITLVLLGGAGVLRLRRKQSKS